MLSSSDNIISLYSPALILIDNHLNTVVDANEAAGVILHISQNELLGMNSTDVLALCKSSADNQTPTKLSFSDIRTYTFSLTKTNQTLLILDKYLEGKEEAQQDGNETGDQLAAERQMLRTVIDLLPDYIYVKDRESKFLIDNLAVAQNLGLTPEKVIGKTDFDFFSKELAQQYYDDEQKVIQTGQPLISREELNYYPLTKTWGWHLTTTVPLRDSKDQIVGIVGVSRNITDHKRAEEALRENIVRQQFAHQLIESQEHERKRIAAELHDSLGQTLLLASNQLHLALRAVGQQGDPSARIEEALALVAQTLQEVRDISHNLRPHHIDELGLIKSIESMIRRLSETSDLSITTNIEQFDEHFSPDSEINLYRIVQETLNNILRHSNATAVEISLHNSSNHLELCISDNGKGFNTDTEVNDNDHHKSFGLMVMNERARMIGADLHISSKPGEGTTISVSLPLMATDHES
jgi:PAS domain S-box-containing protein